MCRYVFHGTLLDTEESDWDRTFDINVKSMFYTSKACVGLVSNPLSLSLTHTHTYGAGHQRLFFFSGSRRGLEGPS